MCAICRVVCGVVVYDVRVARCGVTGCGVVWCKGSVWSAVGGIWGEWCGLW